MIPHHRLIIEVNIGRYLTRQEVIHHKNGNKIDNRIENLEILTNSDHRKLHTKLFLHNRGIKKHGIKVDEVINLRKKGLFAYQIAEITGIPRRTIQRYIKDSGLGTHNIRMKKVNRDSNGRFIN